MRDYIIPAGVALLLAAALTAVFGWDGLKGVGVFYGFLMVLGLSCLGANDQKRN